MTAGMDERGKLELIGAHHSLSITNSFYFISLQGDSIAPPLIHRLKDRLDYGSCE